MRAQRLRKTGRRHSVEVSFGISPWWGVLAQNRLARPPARPLGLPGRALPTESLGQNQVPSFDRSLER